MLSNQSSLFSCLCTWPCSVIDLPNCMTIIAPVALKPASFRYPFPCRFTVWNCPSSTSTSISYCAPPLSTSLPSPVTPSLEACSASSTNDQAVCVSKMEDHIGASSTCAFFDACALGQRASSSISRWSTATSSDSWGEMNSWYTSSSIEATMTPGAQRELNCVSLHICQFRFVNFLVPSITTVAPGSACTDPDFPSIVFLPDTW
mmetsp:Transcript_93377/g.147573  ORF Transcript_93377/g.147573 Transcript_93377/m.147573 type:complete len:204 (+) Transcript_93377:1162-1773(+)